MVALGESPLGLKIDAEYYMVGDEPKLMQGMAQTLSNVMYRLNY